MARKTHGAPAFPGGLMRLFGRGLLVCVVVCLLPAVGEAATITLQGPLTLDSDIILEPIEPVFTDSSLTVELTAGFVPVVTLFGPVTGPVPSNEVLLVSGTFTYMWLTQFEPIGSDDIGPGELVLPLLGSSSGANYLLAISQSPNYFDHLSDPTNIPPFPGGWAADNNADFLNDFIPAECPETQFVATDGCGDGTFTLSYEVRPTTVPEPGTVALLTLGGAALAARRRLRSRSIGSGTP